MQILVLALIQMTWCAADGKLIKSHFRKYGTANSTGALQCAAKHMAVENAGIKFGGSTEVCGPLTRSEITSGSPPTGYFIRTAMRIEYSDQCLNLEVPLPLPVKEGAEFQFKVHGILGYGIDFGNETYVPLHIVPKQSKETGLNTRVGDAWLAVETRFSENLLDGRIATIKVVVKSVGYEISVDGIYKYTYSHRGPFSEIENVIYRSGADPLLMLSWQLPP